VLVSPQDFGISIEMELISDCLPAGFMAVDMYLRLGDVIGKVVATAAPRAVSKKSQ
jgi:hypothetical protein